ncbi:MAG: RNA methyltransferase [Lachnospiraceae bacterium]|nr:RNA methyltransferase [Lachnospiraceae bacterium]
MITSHTNQKIKEVISLLSRRRARRESGLFVVEGIRIVREVPPNLLQALYFSESFSVTDEAKEIKRLLLKETADGSAAGSGPVFEIVADPVFAKMCDTQHPQGALAVVRQPVYTLDEICRIAADTKRAKFLDGKNEDDNNCNSNKKASQNYLILENVQDPGNVGTLLRTAEAAGMDGVFLAGDCADLFNPKTIRSTMGSIFRLPYIKEENCESVIKALQERGVKVFAATLDGSQRYDKTDYTQKAAVIIGNEGNGILRETAEICDGRVHIPMEGQTESLNAAVSGALLMYELRRSTAADQN